MRQSFAIFSICILFLANENMFAQKASDYYMPLSIGNHISLYSPGNAGYWARENLYTIDGIDTIAGKIYYREVGREIGPGDGIPFDEIFRVLWLRADSVSNVIVGAVGGSDSTNIDSATVTNMKWIVNEYLTKGYSITHDYVELMGQFIKDSVVSVSETVSVPAGTFNNCLEIQESTINTGGSIVRTEYLYYARGIGLVKDVIALSHNGAYTYELSSFKVSGIDKPGMKPTPEKFSISQNFPNPFNPSTMIQYQLSAAGFVDIKIYDFLGREMTTLVNVIKNAGTYSVQWNASQLSSGVYFATMSAGGFTSTKKLLLMK